MQMLSTVPWWMFCIGAFSFVTVVTGLVIWQVIQSRMEREDESTTAAGRGLAPPTHPEPLHTWVTTSLAFLDDGSSWMTATPQAGQNLLNDWGVSSVVLLDMRVGELLQQEPTAWNLLRALRMVLAARAAQHLDAAGCWNRARPIALQLQQRYPGFEAIAHDYLTNLRGWKRLPLDGSGDDQEMYAFRQKLDRARTASWNQLPYGAAI